MAEEELLRLNCSFCHTSHSTWFAPHPPLSQQPFTCPPSSLSGISVLNILCPVYQLPLLLTCPKHLRVSSFTVSRNHWTWAFPLIYLLIVLSILATPNENLNNSASCLFVRATGSKTYILAGLTTILWTFPYICASSCSALSLLSSSPLLSTVHYFGWLSRSI